MNQRLKLRIPLQTNGNPIDERMIGEALIAHQEEFGLLFERLAQTDGSRIEIIDDSLEIHDVQLEGTSGSADVEYMSYFHAGCKDMNSEDWHDANLEFTIENDELVFDLPIPIEWRIED